MEREQAHAFATLILRTFPQIKSYLRKTFSPGEEAVGFYKLMLDDLEQLDHTYAVETLNSWKLQADLRPEQVTATVQQIRNGVRERERKAALRAKEKDQAPVALKTVADVVGYRGAQVQQIMEPIYCKLMKDEINHREYRLLFDTVWDYYDGGKQNNARELLKQFGQPAPARS